MQKIVKKNIFVRKALKYLTFGLSSKVGKNFFGRITVFHKKSAYTKKYRIIDYKRLLCSEGCLLTLEKNKSHTAFIGLMFYFNGFFSYIIVPNIMVTGDKYLGFSFKYFKRENYSTYLAIMPAGTWIHHIGSNSSEKGKIARAAGTGCFIYSKWKSYVFVKIPSGKIVRFSNYCIASNGVASNKEYHLLKKKKSRF